MNNVKFDSAESARKNPQPLCLAIAVPSDIRLSIRPAGGERIYAGALHELGHLLHFSTSQESRFELAKLGNPSLHEAFAMLLESLIRDETWLGSNLSFSKDKAADFLSNARFSELSRLRLAAAHVLYEIALRSEPARDPKVTFEAIFGRAFGINLNPDEVARYLVEQEDFYSSVDTLRAATFSAQLLAHLKKKFGVNWWQIPEAGAFLRDLWAPGNGMSIDDAAKKLGGPRLSTTALIQRFSRAVDDKPESTTKRDGGIP